MSLVNLPGPKVKTPSVQTLGVLLFGLYGFAANFALADCMPAGGGEAVVVEYVYDGDTVKLKDGRHVRILGVNAPEVDHGQEKTGQALGDESRQAAATFFKADKTARLFYDAQRTDRYGRTLAHIYDAEGNSLGAHLLRNGLAFHVAIPPNVSLNDCLTAQEAIAQKKRLGVWNHPGWHAKPAASLTQGDTGFQRIKGLVLTVAINRSVWLELDGPFVIHIPEDDLKNFSVTNWKDLEGKTIEVRGWITERNSKQSSQKGTAKSFKPFVLQPRIGSNLEVIP